MNSYLIPLPEQELLHRMLQVGGTAVCPLHRAEQSIQASFKVELTDRSAVIDVDFGDHTGQLTLKRSDPANHLRLRDFIQDIANGRIESAAPAPVQEQLSRPRQVQQMLEESQALLDAARKLLAA